MIVIKAPHIFGAFGLAVATLAIADTGNGNAAAVHSKDADEPQGVSGADSETQRRPVIEHEDAQGREHDGSLADVRRPARCDDHDRCDVGLELPPNRWATGMSYLKRTAKPIAW